MMVWDRYRFKRKEKCEFRLATYFINIIELNIRTTTFRAELLHSSIKCFYPHWVECVVHARSTRKPSVVDNIYGRKVNRVVPRPWPSVLMV